MFILKPGEFASKKDLRDYIDFLEFSLKEKNKVDNFYVYFFIGAIGMFIILSLIDYLFYGFYF